MVASNFFAVLQLLLMLSNIPDVGLELEEITQLLKSKIGGMFTPCRHEHSSMAIRVYTTMLFTLCTVY